MYLSRLTFNPRSRDAMRDAGSTYEFHSTLMRLLPGSDDGERALFRVDEHPDEGLHKALILSRHAPSFITLANGYALHIEGPIGFDPKLQAEQRLAFRLLANPTRKIKSERNPKNGTRVALLDPKAQEDWLRRKLTEAGANIMQVDIRRAHKHLNYKHGDDSGTQTHFGVLFNGILQVEQPEVLKQSLFNGIGTAKGYGFGLLSLSPLNRQ